MQRMAEAEPIGALAMDRTSDDDNAIEEALTSLLDILAMAGEGLLEEEASFWQQFALSSYALLQDDEEQLRWKVTSTEYARLKIRHALDRAEKCGFQPRTVKINHPLNDYPRALNYFAKHIHRARRIVSAALTSRVMASMEMVMQATEISMMAFEVESHINIVRESLS